MPVLVRVSMNDAAIATSMLEKIYSFKFVQNLGI